MFKDRLAEALISRDMKAIDLANKLNISRGVISRYLSGEMMPKAMRMRDIAMALGVRESWLLGEDVSMDYSDTFEEDIETAIDMIWKDGDILRLVVEASKSERQYIRAAYAFLKSLNDQKKGGEDATT